MTSNSPRAVSLWQPMMPMANDDDDDPVESLKTTNTFSHSSHPVKDSCRKLSPRTVDHGPKTFHRFESKPVCSEENFADKASSKLRTENLKEAPQAQHRTDCTTVWLYSFRSWVSLGYAKNRQVIALIKKDTFRADNFGSLTARGWCIRIASRCNNNQKAL